MFAPKVNKSKQVKIYQTTIRLNNKANIAQEFQHVAKTRRFIKQILKKYLEHEFNYKK